MKRAIFAVCCGLLALGAALAPAEDWPKWRGSNADGISKEKNLPASWSKTENVKWRIELPGSGPSTPVIWQDRIFLTSADGERLVLMCFDTDGKELWRQDLDKAIVGIRQPESHSGAPSPNTDGNHVWAFTGTGILACFDFAGKEIWRTNLQERYGEFDMFHGMSTTPLLDGDRLYIQLMHFNAQLVLALEKATGKEIWQHKRTTDAEHESLHSYASPVIFRHDGEELLLSHGSDYIVAHSLKDGSEIWRCGGLQKPDQYNKMFRLVSSPVVAPGLIVVPSAKNGPTIGINPKGAKGDITNSDKHIAWKLESGTTDVPSPLIHDGLVYLCRENGLLVCVDAKTGEEVYMESVYRKRHRASPVYADGKIYLVASDGTVNVIKAGRTYELLATNSMEETVLASLAIANGTIYLRSFDALYAIADR